MNKSMAEKRESPFFKHLVAMFLFFSVHVLFLQVFYRNENAKFT